MKQPGGGKALLFEHPMLMNGTRSAFPVAINLFGSMRRMACRSASSRSTRSARASPSCSS